MYSYRMYPPNDEGARAKRETEAAVRGGHHFHSFKLKEKWS